MPVMNDYDGVKMRIHIWMEGTDADCVNNAAAEDLIPLLSTIPNFPHSFSVHLMNCYFANFWYSRVTEKNTLRREKYNMRKKQDIRNHRGRCFPAF